MSVLKRLNGGMLVGASCSAILIAHVLLWWRENDLTSSEKALYTIVVVSTIGVMCWFSGDNASRDRESNRAMRDHVDTASAERVAIATRQGALRIQLEEVLEKIDLASGAAMEEHRQLREQVAALPSFKQSGAGSGRRSGRDRRPQNRSESEHMQGPADGANVINLPTQSTKDALRRMARRIIDEAETD